MIFFVVRPGEFSYSSLWVSLALSAPAVAYTLIRAPSIAGARSNGVYSNLSLPLAFIIFLMVAIAFFNVDVQGLRLDRLVAREEDLFIRILNLHLVLFFFLCVFRYYSLSKGRNKGRVLLFLGLAISLSIAVLEGRRSAALIPILVLGVFSISQQGSVLSALRKITFFLGISAAIFFVITSIRSPDMPYELIFKAILSRVFNPGYILLEVVEQQNFDFSPDTITNSLVRLGYIFGLNEYLGSTNDFGRYYGFLSSSNLFVGINPGVVVESFLSFGFLYMLPVIFFVEMSFLVLKLYRDLIFGSDLFVAVLVLHGMQMEIPYLLGLLVKLALAAITLRLILVILPVRSAERSVV